MELKKQLIKFIGTIGIFSHELPLDLLAQIEFPTHVIGILEVGIGLDDQEGDGNN
jgi:hypothetical protein